MVSDAARRLLQSMLNKPLYVALRTPLETTRMSELLEAHLQWAIAAEQRGERFLLRSSKRSRAPAMACGLQRT